MIDIKLLRENPSIFQKAADDKNVSIDINEIINLDIKNRKLIQEIGEMRAELKSGSRTLPTPESKKLLKELSGNIKEKEAAQKILQEKINNLVEKIPNIPSDDTPRGKDASSNKVLREVGERPKFHFQPKEHWELGENLGVLDTERASKISGSRFSYILGDLALMQFALIHLVLKTLTDRQKIKKIIKKNKLKVPDIAFTPVVPPVLIKPDVMRKMARLEPKEERYYIPSDDQYLVGSAEHSMGPFFLDEILEEKMLPIRFLGYSTSFRREAGSYGKDVKGILRVHQFDKLEMESFTTKDASFEEQNFFVAIQEYILNELHLPHRVVQICTGDMGAPDARQIDIETWMPGQNLYRETHTSDLVTDYQSRSLKTRVRRSGGELELAHMNDATALAVGRTLIAIMENYQEIDGSIRVPGVLQKYVGKKIIK